MGEGMGKRAELTQAHTSTGSDNGDGAALSAPSRLPLFILSSHDRDMLSGYAMQAGWRPVAARRATDAEQRFLGSQARSEEHTSELQSLMRTSYAVFCLKKQKHELQYAAHEPKQNNETITLTT